MSILGERLLAIDAALTNKKIAHAFGGAIALGYCTADPRATIDIDVNVWVDVDRVPAVMRALPRGIAVTRSAIAHATRDGQVRVRWDDTPVDIFFAVHDFHRAISRETRQVPFEGKTISVLGCDALVVFKAMFNRSKDWADIEAMIRAGAINLEDTALRLQELLGPGDPAVVRLRALAD